MQVFLLCQVATEFLPVQPNPQARNGIQQGRRLLDVGQLGFDCCDLFRRQFFVNGRFGTLLDGAWLLLNRLRFTYRSGFLRHDRRFRTGDSGFRLTLRHHRPQPLTGFLNGINDSRLRDFWRGLLVRLRCLIDTLRQDIKGILFLDRRDRFWCHWCWLDGRCWRWLLRRLRHVFQTSHTRTRSATSRCSQHADICCRQPVYGAAHSQVADDILTRFLDTLKRRFTHETLQYG